MADAAAFANALIAALQAASTPERAAAEKQYLKSDLDFLGATLPTIHKSVKAAVADLSDLDNDALLDLIEELWGRGIQELRMAAVDLAELHTDLLGPGDLPAIERLIREAKTWALVDPLAANVTGGIVERHPSTATILDRWAGDDDFWVRRAAMLALLGPLRRGGGDFDRFARYADAMLEETEFFIRKAIGWVLRDTAKRQPDLVYRWLAPRTHRASGVTMREAVKPLDAPRRDEMMTAYRERRPAG